MNDREIEELIVALEANSHFSVLMALTQLRDERNALRAKLAGNEGYRNMTQASTQCGDHEAKLLLSEDFEGEQLTSKNLTFYTSTPEAYVGAIKPYTTWQGKTCGYYFAQKGTNEKTPWMVSSANVQEVVGADTFDEFCIEWQEWFTTCYPWPHGQKMFRMMYEHGQHPDSKKSFGFSCLNNNGNLQAEHQIGFWGSSAYGSIEWFQNTGRDHPMDAWVTWRVWVKLNTPGQADGFVRITKDGSPLITAESVNLRGTDPKGFNAWWIGGNYSTEGGASTLPRDGDRYIAGIKWWSTSPG